MTPSLTAFRALWVWVKTVPSGKLPFHYALLWRNCFPPIPPKISSYPNSGLPPALPLVDWRAHKSRAPQRMLVCPQPRWSVKVYPWLRAYQTSKTSQVPSMATTLWSFFTCHVGQLTKYVACHGEFELICCIMYESYYLCQCTTTAISLWTADKYCRGNNNKTLQAVCIVLLPDLWLVPASHFL